MESNEGKKAIITSSHPLSDEEKQLILNKFKQLNQAPIEFNVDDRLIAGVKIQIGSTLIELNLRNIINSLKNQLYDSVK